MRARAAGYLCHGAVERERGCLEARSRFQPVRSLYRGECLRLGIITSSQVSIASSRWDQICELVSEVIEEVVIQIPVVASDPGGAERICSLLAAMSLEAWQVATH